MTAPRHPKVTSDKTAKNLQRNTMQTDSERREIIFWDLDNPKSVVNLLSERLKKHAMDLPPHLLSQSAEYLKKEHKLDYIDDQLRIAFWDEFFLTVDNDYKEMRMSAIYARVCSRDAFYAICDNPNRFAYMLHPPEDYILQMRALLAIGLERFKEILKLPVLKPNGQVDTKLIAELTKIVAIVDNRVKGAVTQKIEIDATQKNLHVHARAGNTYEPPKSYDEITSEIRQLDREIKQLRDPTSLEIPGDEIESGEIIDIEKSATS
jgi:hypothetical protein